MQVKVHHWRYELGESDDSVAGVLYHSDIPRGWYCWAYPDDRREFEQWMKTNCPSSYITHKFNSGDPMTLVYIKNHEEATSFKLQWM